MQKPYWSTLTLIVVILFLSACIPAEVDEGAAAETSEARRTRIALTQDAAPTRTPNLAPAATPDKRTLFEKCAQSGIGVRYAISGENVSVVSITLENDAGGSDQGDYKVPFCRKYRDFQTGDFLYISAQISTGSGNIKCQIYDGSTLIAEGNASGFASIATCSGSAN